MKVFIVCVNYNSYKELKGFLDSLNESAKLASNVQVDVGIADNSTKPETVDLSNYNNLNATLHKYDNLGYFGGASAIINTTEDIRQYDYVIISNVDVLFEKDTLLQLKSVSISDDMAWLAPSIYSSKYQRDLNPNIINRYSGWKLRVLRMTYYRFLYRLYENVVYSRKKTNVEHSKMDIYAGHGSFIMLTKNFFKHYQQINYPVFLYCEELFLAELILRKNLKVVYDPSVKVETIGGVSTSKMPSKSFFTYNRVAIDYILKTFY